MPIARVQTPDGRIARIEVPDGATDEQVLQFATSQFGQPEAAAPPPAAAPSVTGEILEPTTKALLRGTAQATVGLPGAFIESAGLERLYGGQYEPDYRQKALDVLRSEQLAIGLGPNEIQAPSEAEIAQEAERQKVMHTFWTDVGKRLDKAAPRDAIIKDTLATIAVPLGRKMQDVAQAATTSELLRDPYRETTPIGERLREKPVQTVLTEGLEQLPNFAVSAGMGAATRGALGAGKLATFGGAGAASYVLEKGDIFNEGAEILAKQHGGRDSVPPEAWDKLNYFAANHGAFNAMLDAIAPSSQVNRAVLAKAGIERVMSKAGLKYVGKEFLKDFLLKELPQELVQEVSTIKAVEQATGRKLSDDEVLARLTQVGVGTILPVGAGSVSASVANVRNAQPPAAAGEQEAPPTAPPPQAGPETPAPPAPSPSVSGVAGAPRRVWTAKGTSVDTNLMVVDADQLTTSHDEAGNINPAFPADLQPRDRSRTASQAQISGMAQALNPELLGDTGQSSSGAPIVGPDGAVESGNARTLAIRQAYDAGRGDNYRQWLTQNAGRFGIDPDQISTIGKPVLVRMRTTPLDPAGRVAFTQESNQADIAPMAPAELAKTDSARITNQDLAQFAPSEDGNVLAASNEPFLRQFAKRIGGLEAGGFTTADGRWTKQMADRVQAAIFARAYADERLTALQSEEADPEIRNIVAGLTRAAPAFARARAVDPQLGNLNITDHLVRAADLIRQARGEGRAVEEVLAQQGLFGDIPPETAALARFMEANKRSPRRMGEAFKMLGERIEDTLRGRQNANLFGPDETSLQDILTMVGARMTEQYGEGVVQGDLLAQEPADDYRRDVFYSALARGIESAKQAKAPAKDWKAIVSKLPGVKAEEIEAVGLSEWLDLQPGAVTREQVLEFVRQNGVQVQEVEKGSLSNIVVRQSKGTDKLWQIYDKDSDRVIAGGFDTEQEARGAIPSAVDQSGTRSGTKFASYQLPGGENYRELLLTLPAKTSKAVSEEDVQAQAKVDAEGAGDAWDSLGSYRRQRYVDAARARFSASGEFKSAHFDEPNILAHVRFNERTDADGKRVLFIEEVQSDWAQKGRKEGFGEPLEVREKKVGDRTVYEVVDRNGSVFSEESSIETARRVASKAASKVPLAPFVTKTDSWSLLAMKRMIRYAAENGFDRIAWTTGEQQAERYDLSRVISRLRWYENEDGSIKLEGDQKNGGVAIDWTGRPEKLDDVVGKDVADKIRQGIGEREREADEIDYKRVGELSGLDLKVGGEGMRAFYDQMLPQLVNKYVKKWGVRVGAVDLALTKKPYNEILKAIGKTSSEWQAMSREERARAISDAGLAYRQHGFDITPAMRGEALEGQPLFEPTPTDQIPITGTSTVALDTQRQAKGEGQDQLDLFTAPGERPVSNQALRRIANETPKVGLVQAGTFRTALTRINTPSEAAHVVASIRKEAQENIIAVATDADGNIVGILRHGIGGVASVGSYPAILLGALHSMPNASKVWFAHNHPSGQIRQSNADRALTDALGKAMQDTGLEMMGMLVVGPNSKTASLYHPNVDDLGEQRTIAIRPGRRTQALPVTERKFVKVRQGDRDAITNEAVAKTQITEIMGEDSGILLTDTQLRPLGYVPMSVADMQKLRTGESATGAGALLRAMHEANATGAFVRIKESGPIGLVTPELKQAALNMKGFFAANSAVTLHDTFIGDQRTDLTESPSTFYANPLQPVWSTYQRLAQKAINAVYGKVGYYLSPLRGLPQKSVFLKRYYDLLGKVSQVQDVEHGIYKAFKAAPKADQPRVYAYLTHKDADPAMIADPGARKKAMAVKRLIDRIGERLVNDGLLSPQARDRHRGEYLPRVYLKYLLDKPAISALGAGQRPGDMGYLKQRKDIPADVRRLILGEVTDPGYLASRAYGIPARDVAFLDFFADIARNKEWIFPYVVAEWRGKPVSVYWLKNEADRLERQAKFMEPAARKEVEDMIQEMRGISEPILDQLRKAPEDFKQVPDTDRYGTLRGLWVRREIHDLILGPQSFNPDNDTAAKIVRAATWYNRIWKTSKVVWNPPSQIRNAISNGVLLHLSGVPFHRVPQRVLQAVQEMRTNGKHWRIAKKYGVKAASFSNQEMLRIERDMLDLLSREQGKMSLSHIMNIVGIVNNAVGDVYQFSESLFKTAKIIDAMEREGMGPADAAIAAHDALFDYSLVPPLVKKLRTSPIGVPFLTFYYKAAPKLIETLVLHPERFLPYFALPYLFAEMIKDSYDVDDDDLKKLKEALPTWLREKGTAYILPVKDEHGRWQAFDYGYFMPWGMYQELYNEASYLASRGEVGSAGNVLGTLGLLGGPVPDMITAVQTNIDPFTRREISNKFDPPSKQLSDTLSYVWRLNAPTWVTDIGAAGHLYRSLTGAVNPRLGPQFGEPMSTPMQAGARFFGVNLYPIDPEATRAENIRAMSFEIRNTVRRLRDQLRNPNLTPEQRQEMQAQYKAEIDSRQSQLQVYMERSEVHPNLRRGAIIPDENL